MAEDTENTGLTPTVTQRKIGRPSKYNPTLAATILSRLASSTLGIQAICESDPSLPHFSVVYDWRKRRPIFAEAFARAREMQADLLVYETIKAADTPLIGVRRERRRIGWICSKCHGPAQWCNDRHEHMDGSSLCAGARAEAVMEEKVIEGDNVERSKAMIGSRQWIASRIAPRDWGDRQAIEQRLVDGEGKDRPLTLEDYREMVETAEKINGSA